MDDTARLQYSIFFLYGAKQFLFFAPVLWNAREEFFNGHFPSEPVMPGVLQVEAMAQTGGVFFLHGKPDPENYTTLFLKIDNTKFKQKVIPGDTIIFELKLISPLRRGLCQMKGTAYVGNKVVMESEMTAQITKNE